MNKTNRFLFIPLGFLLLSGCVATRENVNDLSSQMNVLNATLKSVQKNQAELNAKINTLTTNLGAYSENLKDFNDQFTRLESKLDDLENTLSKSGSGDKNMDATNSSLTPTGLYNDSYSYLMQKKYSRAVEGFNLYLEKFPDGSLSENSYYYLGDAYAGLGETKKAAISYAKLLEKYRNSEFTPSARLKYADSILKLPEDRNSEAVRYLKSISRDFPNSPEARLAKEKLESIAAK
jgi:tol-pal system protein YbgF